MKLGKPKICIILFVAVYCHAFDELTFYLQKEPTWRNMLPFTNSDQTIFIDIDNESSVIFKDSVVKSIHDYNNSVILVRAEFCEQSFVGRINILEENPNVVFTTNFLDTGVLDRSLLSTMLRSHWSALIIIVTIKDNMYNCDNGTFNDEAFNNIEQFFNDIWYKHRIINVYLNLPYVCPNDYVVYDLTKPTDGELYNRTIKLVRLEQVSQMVSRKSSKLLTRNYPLRGNIFQRFPTAIQDCEGTDIYIKTSRNTSGGFCGMDGLVMSDIVTQFEFNLSLSTFSSDDNRYGYQRPDGIITGSLGRIVRRDVDLSFNSRFVAQYTTGPQQYKYIYYVASDALCAVLNQPDEEPLRLYPINSYSWMQWLFILACLISIGILMWIFAKIQNKIHNTGSAKLPFYVLNSLNAGLFGFFFKPRRDLLLLRAGCLFASIMLLAEYQGYINYIFTTRVRFDVLNSLSDLAESETVIQTSPSIYIFVNESINDVGEVLRSRTIVVENEDSFDYVILHRNTATLERQSDAIMLTLMKYTDGDGKPKLYVMNDCFRFFYLAYIANVEFPFVSAIRVFMMRLVETGLTKMYYTWTSRALGLEVTLPSLYSEPRPAARIKMQEQVVAFSVLLVGYAAAMAAFVVEIWLGRRQTYPFIH